MKRRLTKVELRNTPISDLAHIVEDVQPNDVGVLLNHLMEPVSTSTPSLKRDYLKFASQVIARYKEAISPLLPKLGPSLIKKLKERDGNVRDQAADVYASLGFHVIARIPVDDSLPELLNPLLKMVTEPGKETSVSAALAAAKLIGNSGEHVSMMLPKLIPRLLSLFSHPGIQARPQLLQALNGVVQSSASTLQESPLLSDIVGTICTYVPDTDVATRKTAIEVLSVYANKLGSVMHSYRDRVLEVLDSIFNDKTRSVKEALTVTIPLYQMMPVGKQSASSQPTTFSLPRLNSNPPPLVSTSSSQRSISQQQQQQSDWEVESYNSMMSPRSIGNGLPAQSVTVSASSHRGGSITGSSQTLTADRTAAPSIPMEYGREQRPQQQQPLYSGGGDRPLTSSQLLSSSQSERSLSASSGSTTGGGSVMEKLRMLNRQFNQLGGPAPTTSTSTIPPPSLVSSLSSLMGNGPSSVATVANPYLSQSTSSISSQQQQGNGYSSVAPPPQLAKPSQQQTAVPRAGVDAGVAAYSQYNPPQITQQQPSVAQQQQSRQPSQQQQQASSYLPRPQYTHSRQSSEGSVSMTVASDQMQMNDIFQSQQQLAQQLHQEFETVSELPKLPSKKRLPTPPAQQQQQEQQFQPQTASQPLPQQHQSQPQQQQQQQGVSDELRPTASSHQLSVLNVSSVSGLSDMMMSPTRNMMAQVTESALAQLRMEHQRHADQMTTAHESVIAGLKENHRKLIGAREFEIQRLQAAVSHLQQEVDAGKQREQQFQRQIALKEEQEKDLEATLQRQIQLLDQENKQMHDVLAQAQAASGQVLEQLTIMSSAKNSVERERDALIAERTHLNERMAKLQEHNDTLQQSEEWRVRQQLEDLQNDHSELQENFANLQASFNHLQTENTQLKADMTSKQDAWKRYAEDQSEQKHKTEYERLEKAGEELRAQLRTLETEKADLAKHLADSHTVTDHQQSLLSQAKESEYLLRQQIAELDRTNAHLREQVQAQAKALTAKATRPQSQAGAVVAAQQTPSLPSLPEASSVSTQPATELRQGQEKLEALVTTLAQQQQDLVSKMEQQAQVLQHVVAQKDVSRTQGSSQSQPSKTSIAPTPQTYIPPYPIVKKSPKGPQAQLPPQSPQRQPSSQMKQAAPPAQRYSDIMASPRISLEAEELPAPPSQPPPPPPRAKQSAAQTPLAPGPGGNWETRVETVISQRQASLQNLEQRMTQSVNDKVRHVSDFMQRLDSGSATPLSAISGTSTVERLELPPYGNARSTTGDSLSASALFGPSSSSSSYGNGHSNGQLPSNGSHPMTAKDLVVPAKRAPVIVSPTYDPASFSTSLNFGSSFGATTSSQRNGGASSVPLTSTPSSAGRPATSAGITDDYADMRNKHVTFASNSSMDTSATSTSLPLESSGSFVSSRSELNMPSLSVARPGSQQSVTTTPLMGGSSTLQAKEALQRAQRQIQEQQDEFALFMSAAR